MGLPIEKLLAENLGKIFAQRGITSAAKAQEVLRVPKSTIDRAWHCRSMARLDTLGEVAAGLKVQPWQLLVPDMDPKEMPTLSGESAATPAKQKPPASPTTVGQVDADELMQLISAFSHATAPGREQILRMARSAPKEDASVGVRPASNKR